ncbi:MAG: lipopolysaccharide biosynthesis protein [Actinomycetota bacterium]
MGNLFTSALLVVSMRWIDRLLGITSTLVLARLLMPADFGIVAMASVVVGLIDVLLDLGVIPLLVQKKDCDDEDFSNGWSLRVLQCLLVSTLIAVTSPLAADFYHDGRVAPVLQLMALGILVSGFENIGVVNFQKEMLFRKDFQFFFLRRFTGFAATLVFALTLESYWALPLGALAGRIGGVAISYAMHPFRPRFTLSRLRQFWSFSQWMLLLNSGEYFAMRLDKFLVGHRADAAAVGAYSLADEISVMPTSELLMPIGRVLFPAFVKVRERPAELQYAYLLALAVQAMIAIPAAVGLASIAHDAVALLLGEHWMSAVPFVQVLALVYGLNAFSHGASYLLLTLGRVRIMAIAIWTQILVLGLGAITFLADAQALQLAQWRLAVSVLYTLAFVILVLREVPTLRAREMLAVVWRPFVAAGAMAYLLSLLALEGWPLLAAIGTRIATGAAVYALALLALWNLAGRPRGAETYLLEKLAFVLRRPVAAVKPTD